MARDTAATQQRAADEEGAAATEELWEVERAVIILSSTNTVYCV